MQLRTRFRILTGRIWTPSLRCSAAGGLLLLTQNAAVGPNHVVITTNSVVQVFSKTGTALTAPARISTLLVGIANAADDDGDPIVIYDSLADRWVISQFNLTVTANSTHEHIAVSKTGDPTGAYYAYDFLMTANRPR